MWNKFRISPTVSKTQSAHNSIYVVRAQHWTPFALNIVGKIAIENGLFYTNTVAEALLLHVNRFHWKRSKFIGFSYHSSNYEIFTYSPIDFNFLFHSSIKRRFVLVCSVPFWLNGVSFQSIPCFHGFSHNIIYTFFVAFKNGFPIQSKLLYYSQRLPTVFSVYHHIFICKIKPWVKGKQIKWPEKGTCAYFFVNIYRFSDCLSTSSNCPRAKCLTNNTITNENMYLYVRYIGTLSLTNTCNHCSLFFVNFSKPVKFRQLVCCFLNVTIHAMRIV